MEAQVHCAGNARRHKTAYLLAADTVLKSTYRDDSLDSVEDDDMGDKVYHKLQEKGGMHARKWVSNSKRVIAATSNSWIAMEQCRRHVRDPCHISTGGIPNN